jgi:hypothetical protein
MRAIVTGKLGPGSTPAGHRVALQERFNPSTRSVAYNQNHTCLEVRGTFAPSDDSESGSRTSVRADADGAPWFSQTFSVDGLDGFGVVGTPEVCCTQ